MLLDDLPTQQASRPSITTMLTMLANGVNTKPKRIYKCVIADIDDAPSLTSVNAYAARVFGLSDFLSNYYMRTFKAVGAENHCIRVFFEPLGYDAKVRADLFERVDIGLFHAQMRRFDIARLFVYGKTLVIRP